MDGTIFRSGLWRDLIQDNGDTPVDKTYRIVITNNILLGSRNISFTNHKKLVHKLGCKIPKALEIVTLIALTYISSKQSLYASDPPTYTYCSEKTRDQYMDYQVIVGGVCVHTVDLSASGNFIGHPRNGISAVLKL